MKKIIAYGVATGEADVNILVKDVNEHIAQGYQPIGGITSTTCEGVVCFAQAMVKYED
jgi:hypothetical protein